MDALKTLFIEEIGRRSAEMVASVRCYEESTTDIPENYLDICLNAQCGRCDGARIPEMFDGRCQKDIHAHEGCYYLELTGGLR